ncbi:MAG: 3-hydroxyacyl-CoA dehydrogenase, partial [Hyphomicrobiales bacterium]|nr:3-hydroxyacyl-CoA dehydrogenase [Hyphomicrobiales bacterium]
KAVDPKAIDPVQEKLLSTMVETHGRLGRKNGKGFYDYPEKGQGRKKLWPGLKEVQPVHLDADAIDKEELKQRLLVTQALEAARTMVEGVITDPREADVGSILGFGFAPFTGGTISYIDGMGTKRFVELADRLEKKHGPRFAAPTILRDMASRGESFYGRFTAIPNKAA